MGRERAGTRGGPPARRHTLSLNKPLSLSLSEPRLAAAPAQICVGRENPSPAFRKAGEGPRDPGKSENAWFLRGTHPGGWAPFEFLKMHLYQYTQKIEHCSNKFDFLPLFCLVGLVPSVNGFSRILGFLGIPFLQLQ